METVLYAPGQDADDALMPGGIEKAQRVALAEFGCFDGGQRLLLHGGLDRAAVSVQLIELSGDA